MTFASETGFCRTRLNDWTRWYHGRNMDLPGSRLRVRLEQLELAKGHDGFLRGKPEPVIVLGIFFVESRRARLLSREILHFEVPEHFPATVTRLSPLLPAKRYPHSQGAHLVLLALAIEEDSGRDIRDFYAMLERVDDIDIWLADGSMRAPRSLHRLPVDDRDWHRSQRVRVLLGGVEVAKSCRKDDWVDASLAVLATDRQRTTTRRMHFMSKNQRNDWTAQIHVALW